MRGDSERHASALQDATNFVITPHGGAAYRQGMEYIGAPVTDAAFRLMQFHGGGDVSDILLEVSATQDSGVTKGKIRYWRDDALIEDPLNPPTPMSNDNNYTPDELDDLYFVNQEYLGIICITLALDGTISARQLPQSKIPLVEYNDEKSEATVDESQATYQIGFTNYEAGDLYEMNYGGIVSADERGVPIEFRYAGSDAAAQQRNIDIIFAGLRNISLITQTSIVTYVGNVGGVETYSITLTGSNAGKHMQFFTINSANSQGFVSIDNATVISGTEPAWSYPYVVTREPSTDPGNTHYYQCKVPHLADPTGGPFVNQPGDGSDWQTYWDDIGSDPTAGPWPNQPPWFEWQHKGDSASADVTTWNPWAGNTAAGNRIYSPWDRGFPTVAGFHEQRLIFAASKEATTTLWGSRVGESDDPFQFALDTSDTPTIKWMASQLNLMVGTSSGDWNLSGEVTLGPGDVSAVKQNNARSHHTRAVVVDTEVFYIEQGQTKVRATRYVRDYNGFASHDVSVAAEHLLYDGMKRLVVQFIPEVLLVMIERSDQGGSGQLRFLSYNKAGEVAAWSAAETQGTINDIAAYYTAPDDSNPFGTGQNEDSLYCAVRRFTGSWYIEKMPYPKRNINQALSLSEQNIVYLDSWLKGTILADGEGGDGQTIYGLEHLEGQFVGILVSDAYQDGEYQVVGGQVSLNEPHPGERYVVGLNYTGALKTFEHLQGNPRGTGLGTARKWNKLYVRTYDSARPIIQDDLPPDRTPATDMGTAETLILGLHDHRMHKLGFGDGSITIRQDRPYPTHILGVFGEYSSENV
jgi:hypothetical protein